MKWRWLLGVPLLLTVGTCGALMGMANIEARDRFEEQRAALGVAMAKHGDAFRADLRVASALAFLSPLRSSRKDGDDAGPVLRERLRTTGVPPPLAKKLSEAVVGKFPGNAIDLDLAGLRLGWMSELSRHDRWELLEERPVRFHGMELPDAAQLNVLARARLLQGLAMGDVKSAGHDVEELARLVVSTEHWAVVQNAPTLMQLLRQTFEYARAEGLDVAGWQVPDRKEIEASRRALRSYAGVLDFHADPSLHGELLRAPDASAGRCAALNEVATVVLEMEPVTGDRYRPARAWVQQAIDDTAGSCRLTLVREAFSDPHQRVLAIGSDAICDANEDAFSCVAASIILWFPGMRDVLLEAGTVDAADLFSDYGAST